ncbi:MAG TPA: class I SAM-dependent methyltransferase [Verrucomicrobiales bacterium]|nr:class I SAM-dependent methyltransferase [Verrucomicrobiales bacterium]
MTFTKTTDKFKRAVEVAPAPDLRESVIACRNSQGAAVKGSLLRLTRYSVVFEIYSPYSIIQLSEVLRDFQIFLGNRMVYQGRAVVSSLVNTGILMVCEASLDEAWVDIDFLDRRRGQHQLRDQFESFIEEWKRIHTVLDGFKVVVADLQTLFVGLQQWLSQVELGLRSVTSGSRRELEHEVFDQIESGILERTASLLQHFESVAAEVPPDQVSIHKTYVRRQIHPVVLCAPFVYRSYEKPLGYAGDYEMVNMMLRDPYEGSSLFAKALNYVFLEAPPVQAHRNRIAYLERILEQEVIRVQSSGRRAAIYNLGCGPAQEVEHFVDHSPAADFADFTLLDFNRETVEFVRTRLDRLLQRRERDTRIEVVERSVHQILKDSVHLAAHPSGPAWDVIYCAGLFDYLSERVCAHLLEVFYRQLTPGGLIVATNVSDNNPSRRWMEFVVEWNLIYRNEKQLLELVAPERRATASVRPDSTGVNLFLEIRKGER